MAVDERSCCAEPLNPPPRAARRSPLVRLLLLATLAGVFARCLAYAANLQVYHDEAYLVNSMLVRDYGELLQPLGNHQIAPPAFCWGVRWCVTLSDTDRVLRLLPFAAGMASLALFGVLCRTVLRGSGAWFALAILSVSHVTTLSSIRAKPYSTDLLVSLVITLLSLRWLSRPERTWPLILLAILAPAAVWLSYTSLFVIGGAGLVMGVWSLVHRQRTSPRSWAALAAVGVLSAASFGLLFEVNLKAAITGAGDRGAMYDAWASAFPPLESLPRTLWWLVTAHTGRLYAYPIGEKNFGSIVSFVCWCVGVAALWRRRQRRLLALLLAPQGLLLAAAFAGKYPYGGHARISLFLAPAMCLLIGEGVARWTQSLTKPGRELWRGIATLVLLFLAAGVMVRDGVEAYATYRKDSLRRVVLDVRDRAREGHPILCLNRSMLLTGGGASRQVFEYYMQRLLGGKVHWGWDGQWPATARAGGAVRLHIIEFVSAEEPDAEAAATRDALRTRYGDAFDPKNAQRCTIRKGFAGEMLIYRLDIPSPVDTATLPFSAR